MVAYFYPYFGVFWSMLFFYVWIMWLFLLFRIFADIFRSEDLSGLAKAMWLVLVILLPFLGVLIYMVARNDSMAARAHGPQHSEGYGSDRYDNYSSADTATDTIASQLGQLAELKASGVLTDAEFETQKARLLT